MTGIRLHAHTHALSLAGAAVVLNLPVVPSEKYDKLAAVIKKIYGSIGTIREGEEAGEASCLVAVSPGAPFLPA